eukprot:TRINITY_DN53_c0_g1_i1.p1 TRINITY_DN53_c0_g1~~TRINITY_DN53_c0_g1_i1.p1  ORF type:complete len:577 (-),score=183.50 TRINITY_DN53_c0_g1_i1:135-1865(-)
MLRLTRVARVCSALKPININRIVASSFVPRRRMATTGKDIVFGDEARKLLLQGVDAIVDAVQTTLGPKGRNVAIEQSWGSPKITKDGVTVAKAVDLPNKQLNLGAQLIKQVCSKTNDTAGDGTTTAAILARAIYREGVKAVASGMNPMDIRRGITAATEAVLVALKSMTQPLTNKENIAQVATISANGDKKVGKLIADAIEKVGREGAVTVEDGKTVEDELEVVEGMKMDRGFINPYFMTNARTQRCEYSDAYVLLYDGKLSSLQDTARVLELVKQNPLLIIAEDVEGDALATLLINRLRQGLKVCAVKAPGFGDQRKAIMSDLAASLGATLICEELGMKLETIQLSHLGKCKKMTITKDDSVLVGGGGQKAAVEERIGLIKSTLSQTTSDWEKEKLQQRLASLVGGVGVIRVGGASEVEMNEKKDRVIDALNATRAAVEEGIVTGGGFALLYASQVLKDLKVANHDQQVGVNIMKQALTVPCKTIISNGGEDGPVIAGRLIEEAKGNLKCQYGYDIASGKYGDMIKMGVLDPTKVVRTCLVNSSGVASLAITTEAMITDAAEKSEESGCGHCKRQ